MGRKGQTLVVSSEGREESSREVSQESLLRLFLSSIFPRYGTEQ